MTVKTGSSRPLLYVDVDGVLNAYASREQILSRFEEIFTVDAVDQRGRERTLTIRVPAGTRQRIATLCEVFEPVWATTWERQAPELLSPTLGFGADWPVVELAPWTHHPLMARACLSDPYTPKLGPILYHAADRPMAWIDDQVARDAVVALGRRTRQVAPSLLAQPKPSGGLADRHLRRLLAFAGELDADA